VVVVSLVFGRRSAPVGHIDKFVVLSCIPMLYTLRQREALCFAVVRLCVRVCPGVAKAFLDRLADRHLEISVAPIV